MKFAVLFEDDPVRGPEARTRHMSEHLQFLQRHAEEIEAAGPLIDELGTPTGGLWVVEAANFERVEILVRDDPFWPSGLRKSVRILNWRQVFVDGRQLP